MTEIKFGNIYLAKLVGDGHEQQGVRAVVIAQNDKGNRYAPTVEIIPMSARINKARHLPTHVFIKADATNGLHTDSLVFTDELGRHLTKSTLYRDFKKIVASIDRPDAKFHDLRHSYAVASIRSGDDIKTVQGNLGHATAAFTLDVYGHVTDQMKTDSANRMEAFIKSVSAS